jgi:hypothetical protein
MQENEHIPLDDFVLRLRKWAQVTPWTMHKAN